MQSNLEIIWAIIELTSQKLIIGVCYRPPHNTPTFINELHDIINLVCTRHTNIPLFLLGDFNIPNISWENEPPTLQPFSTFGNDFFNTCSVFSLSQLIRQPTRSTQTSANILDLVLTSRPDYVSSIAHLPGLSDHCMLSFDINLPRPKSKNKIKTIRLYERGNFDAFNEELSGFLDPFLEDFDCRSVQTNWDMFSDKIKELTDKYIPTRIIVSNDNAPWYTTHLKRLSNRKERLYNLARLSPSSVRWAAYKEASKDYVTALKNAKENFLITTLPSMLSTDTKKFWRVINPPQRW